MKKKIDIFLFLLFKIICRNCEKICKICVFKCSYFLHVQSRLYNISKYIYIRKYISYFKNATHSFILSLNVPARSPSAAWHRFAFLRQMNISAPSGNSMATAQSPLYGHREMSPAHQPPRLYLLSLSPYHSRRLPVPHSPQSSRCIFSFFLTLWQDTAATDNIYYKTWPFLCSPSMLVYLFAADKARKEIPCLMTKVCGWSANTSATSFRIFVQFRLLLSLTQFYYYTQNIKWYALYWYSIISIVVTYKY